ncbi:hypothetical protein RE9425_29820 [Prescottella equi]|nr:hypothetical protein RE9425_29820 [Prescottella equi]BCN79318.1 hypothetical protein RE0346_29780 [Prescottella equi]
MAASAAVAETVSRLEHAVTPRAPSASAATPIERMRSRRVIAAVKFGERGGVDMGLRRQKSLARWPFEERQQPSGIGRSGKPTIKKVRLT